MKTAEKKRGKRAMWDTEVSYDEYEEQCRKIRSMNDELLDLFASDLRGLTEKTVRKHVSNVSFYINSFLLYGEPLTFEYGTEKLDEYLGYYFIRKYMWSTPASIKSTAASIKKFYKCMLDHGKIEKKDYKLLCEEIKERLPVWQADCAQYNDPDEDSPFDFF